jgi:serine/threonine-protein kinase HipA
MKKMNKCLFCYQLLDEEQIDFHPKCSRRIFNQVTAPILPYDYSELEQLAKDAAELSISVTGVQPKLSLGWIRDGLKRSRLTIVGALDGNYILKPQNSKYDQMPENEHVTMLLAQIFGIDTVPVSLIRLKSGELSFITKRIDRNKDGSKNHMIDFHQIFEFDSKYKGTTEKLGKKIGELSSMSLFDRLRFLEVNVFNFIVGNNDMHLKNFSMFLSENGWVLSPFYDLINVKLVLPKDHEELALLLGGKKQNFGANYFYQLGKYLELNDNQINNVIKRLDTWLPKAINLLNISFLNNNNKQKYIELINTRSQLFTA